jgi:hypothetical protein
MRERSDRETALRDCLQRSEPYVTYNQPLAAKPSTAPAPATATASGNAAAAQVLSDLGATGAEAEQFVWPSVSVLCPVCVKRHRWLPNLYAMFAHQNYPGPIVRASHPSHVCCLAKSKGF